MSGIIGFIIGFVIGVLFGLITFALISAASDRDDIGGDDDDD